jgi:hypothetical protein
MLPRIPFLFAFNALLIITSGILLFHIAIMMEYIPYAQVWGGRVRSQNEMIRFERISILVNAVFLLIIYLKIKRYRAYRPTPWINALLWVFSVVYLINTVGNLMSFSNTETIVFTPLTLILAILSARVAMEK